MAANYNEKLLLNYVPVYVMLPVSYHQPTDSSETLN